MNKIQNSISTVICNDHLDALEINFQKKGNLQEYNHSMQLAIDLSSMHHINHWIIDKYDFNDISVENFLMLVFNWAKIMKTESKNDQSLIITSKKEVSDSIYSVLRSNWWLEHYSRPEIRIRPVSRKNKQKIVEQEFLH